MSDIKQSCFTTQVLSQQRKQSLNGPKFNIRHSLFVNSLDSPYQKVKRLKQQMKQAKKVYMKSISENHKIQYSLSKIQRNRQLKKAQFMKIYGNIKYKRSLQNTISENQYRVQSMHHQRTINTKKKKLQQDLERRLIKNQQQYKIEQLQKKNRQQKQKWTQKKFQKTNQFQNWSKNKHDQIKGQHRSFVIRKSNISQMLHQRSKLNYIRKVNKELNLLKQYQQVMNDINSYKVQQLQKMMETEDFKKIDHYQTFFTTTKNTISY